MIANKRYQYMDILYIDQLVVMSSIGIYDWEKQRLQKLVFDLELTCSDKYFATNTNISNYLDYTRVNNIILNTMNGRHFLFIENVAETMVKILMKEFSIISWIRLKVNKPNAMHNVCSVGICIERRKEILFI